jgi:ribosome-associated translation inhibitor RaiA
MELPGPDVSASEERHDLRETVHDAFAEIRRQVEKYRRKLNHTVEYKRPARRDRLRRVRAGVEPVKQRRQTRER